MYLSKVSLLGFKSFPFKTEIILDSGITAIVGPNGCGKTNILDAIRWVLGEQKTSVLRGDRMEEIIFNGTKELKPMGMAEVRLTIYNESQILPIEYSEVEITRRFFRSGESEFFLNKVPCRLKDIVDLFLDTGVGAHSYSMIQQEMIDTLLSSNTDGRRFLFEEAAGISKYKKRKRETERKLLATENDIQRIKDVMAEVETQVNSLKRQAQKAKRFKDLQEKLKDLELKLFKEKHKDLILSLNQIDMRFEKKDSEKEENKKEIKEKEKELASLKAELLKKEKEISSLQERDLFLSQSSHEVETEILIKKDQKENLEELINKSSEEIKNLNSKIFSIKEELKEKEKELTCWQDQSKNKEKESLEIEQALKSQEERVEKAKKEFRGLSIKSKEVEEKLNRSEYELKIEKSKLEQRTKQNFVLAEKEKKLDSQLKENELKLNQLSSEYKEKQNLLEKERKAQGEFQKEFNFLSKDLENFLNEKIRLESELKLQNAEHKILDELLVTYEGYGSGTKAILENKKNLFGIVDSLANLIKTEDSYLSAIEQALGEALNYIVCEDEESAKSAINFLKEKRAGKATFLILSRLQDKKIDFKSLDAYANPDLSEKKEFVFSHKIIGWANELIQCDQTYKILFGLFLGRVLVVSKFENLFENLSFLDDFSNYDIVSLDGEVFRKGFILEGGEKKEVFLLGRQDRINSIKQKIVSIKNNLEKIKTQITNLSEKKGQIELNLKEKGEKIENLKLSIDKNVQEIKELTFKKDMLFSELEEIKDVKDKEDLKISELTLNLKEKEKENLSFSKEKELLGTQLEESKKISDDLERGQEESYKKLNDLRFETVSLQGKEEKLKSESKRLLEVIDELKSALLEKDKEKKNFFEKLQTIKSYFEEKEKRKEELSQQKELQKKIVESKENIKKGLFDSTTEIEKDLESLRKDKEVISEELHQIQLEKLTISSEIQRLKEKVWEEYQIETEKLSLPEGDEKENIEEHKNKVWVLKERLKKIGTVNLLALDEYQSQKKRLDFLTSQLDDLLCAKDSLNEAIVIINKTARGLFLETFEKIKANFQKVFSELFEGGEADIRLKDGDDPLEAFIEITANPKGKSLLSLNQLSGGEKALIAISLLFAIYLVKPSPFCVLDEVDAPLDDANLLRFIKLLKNFSQNTQFVIITHNKLTMEAADVLHGVTMEKSGVSKIVSVKLKKEEIIA